MLTLAYQVRVTRHCIEQFKRRNFQYDLPEESAQDIIESWAQHFKIIRKRPSKDGCRCYEAEFQNHYFVIKQVGQIIVVITYLGDGAYRKWATKQEIRPRYKKIS